MVRDNGESIKTDAHLILSILGLQRARLSLVELFRVHLGSCITDDVELRGQETLSEELEKGGEGLWGKQRRDGEMTKTRRGGSYVSVGRYSPNAEGQREHTFFLAKSPDAPRTEAGEGNAMASAKPPDNALECIRIGHAIDGFCCKTPVVANPGRCDQGFVLQSLTKQAFDVDVARIRKDRKSIMDSRP